MTRSLLTAAFLCTLPSLAMAQDDDLPGDALPETESVADDSVAPPPIEEADLLDVGDEPEDLDFEDDEDDSGDLLEDGANGSQARAEGEDTDELYREQQNQLIESSPEDVLTAWEAYLQTYPNSLYQSLIAKHIGEAESEMYGEGISQGSEQKVDMRGLRVPETAMGENLNPATRVKFGFDWGLPEYINLIGDFEYALAPQLSVHAAMRKRYTGWSAEAGARYAFVKSESAGLLITGIGDMRLNVEPGYLGFRPQVGVAKELFGKIWLQGQGGMEWEHFDGFWSSRWMANGNVNFRASDAVSMYVETNFHSKYPNWPSGGFYYHLTGFGMRFYPGVSRGSKSDNIDKTDVLLGASVPVAWNHWEFHKGAATVQGNFYLD